MSKFIELFVSSCPHSAEAHHRLSSSISGEESLSQKTIVGRYKMTGRETGLCLGRRTTGTYMYVEYILEMMSILHRELRAGGVSPCRVGNAP